MNARILRKWSIHTKNLMSCSVCSFVVVVLLLILVTCAPTLVLATTTLTATSAAAAISSSAPPPMPASAVIMSFPSRSDRSFAPNPVIYHHHHHRLPKDVVLNKETSASSSLSSVATATATTTAAPATLFASATSSPPPQLLLKHAYLNHRLASSIKMEVVKNYGTSTRTQPQFPGHNTNNNSHNIYTKDDTQLTPPLSRAAFGGNTRNWPLMHNTKTFQRSQNEKETWKSEGSENTHHLSSSHHFNEHILKHRGEWPDHVTPQSPLPPSALHSMPTSSSSAFVVDRTRASSRGRLGVRYMKEEDEAVEAAQYYQFIPDIHAQLNRHTIYSASSSSTSSSSSSQANENDQTKPPAKNFKDFFSTESQPGDTVFAIDSINTNINKPNLDTMPQQRPRPRPPSQQHFVIESYEVPAALPLAVNNVMKERRMLISREERVKQRALIMQQKKQKLQQQQQAVRNRRDSLRGSFGGQQHYEDANAAMFRHYQQSSPILHRRLRQRMRKHSRRYCSARDPAQLAFEAPTVFEGKIVSMTPDRRTNFSATVEVRDIFKQQIGYRLQKYLRLQFSYSNSSGECDIYREILRTRGLVRGDTIEPGRIYLLFVQQIDIGNFTILGQPIRKTKRVVEAVKNAVSENYAQLASIRSISASNRTVENGQELRIVCKVSGQPPPKVTWFKDHKSINGNRKLYQFIHYKKRSELIIRSFNTSDAGRYECRAKNKVNRNIERRVIVIKAFPVQRFDPNPGGTGNTCPDDASEFCFNGGTCKFFSEIGSYSCICPEGFIGERCDRKEVNNIPPSTYSNEHECSDKTYLGSYYC